MLSSAKRQLIAVLILLCGLFGVAHFSYALSITDFSGAPIIGGKVTLNAPSGAFYISNILLPNDVTGVKFDVYGTNPHPSEPMVGFKVFVGESYKETWSMDHSIWAITMPPRDILGTDINHDTILGPVIHVNIPNVYLDLSQYKNEEISLGWNIVSDYPSSAEISNIEFIATPEPSTVVLTGIGLLMLLACVSATKRARHSPDN